MVNFTHLLTSESRKCKVCGNSFFQRTGRQLTCSPKCRRANYLAKRKRYRASHKEIVRVPIARWNNRQRLIKQAYKGLVEAAEN